jgi:hypothetical protein
MERKPHVCRRLNFDDEANGEDTTCPDDNKANSEDTTGFGDLHSHDINFLQNEMRRDLQTAIQRWNFDFENDVPLEGQWEWEPVLESEPREEQMQPQAETDEDTPEH